MSCGRYSIALLGCALLLGRCGRRSVTLPPLAPEVVKSTHCRPGGGGGYVVYSEDPELLTRLRVDWPECSRSPGHHLLQVRLPIENVSDEEVRFAVQVEFLDRHRAFYGDRTTRRILVIPPGGSESFRTTSVRSKAAAFVVLLTLP